MGQLVSYTEVTRQRTALTDAVVGAGEVGTQFAEAHSYRLQMRIGRLRP